MNNVKSNNALEIDNFLITLDIIKKKNISDDDVFMDIADVLDANGYDCIGRIAQTKTVKMKNGDADMTKSCKKHCEEILSFWK